MSVIKKYTDWQSYWVGLRTNLFKCIGTTGTSWLGSNAIANIGVDSFKPLALNWEQACGMFAVHIGFEIFTYMKNVQPVVITETCDTSHISKDPVTGKVTEIGSSRTVTQTPVIPETTKDTP